LSITRIKRNHRKIQNLRKINT